MGSLQRNKVHDCSAANFYILKNICVYRNLATIVLIGGDKYGVNGLESVRRVSYIVE